MGCMGWKGSHAEATRMENTCDTACTAGEAGCSWDMNWIQQRLALASGAWHQQVASHGTHIAKVGTGGQLDVLGCVACRQHQAIAAGVWRASGTHASCKAVLHSCCRCRFALTAALAVSLPPL